MTVERPIEKDIAYGAAFVFGFATSIMAEFPVTLGFVGGLLAVVFAFLLISLYDSIQYHGLTKFLRDAVITYVMTAVILAALNVHFEFQPWDELKLCLLVGIPVIPLATGVNLRPRTVLNKHPFRDC